MRTRLAGFQPVPEGAPQLALFFRGLWLGLGGFAAVSGAQFFTQGRPTAGLIAVLLLAAAGIVMVATRFLAAGQIRPAVLLTSGAVLGLILVVGLLVPIEAEAAVAVLLAVAAGLPYLQGRALGALMVAAWVVGVVVVVAHNALPQPQVGPPIGASDAAVGALSIALALGLVLYVLWKHSRQLRGAIVDREREHLTARLLFAASPIPTWLVDRDSGAILDVNDAAVSGYGQPREAFLGLRFGDLRESPGETVATAAHRNERHRTRDGAVLDVQVDAHEVSLDGRAVLLVSATDLTAERRSQQQRAQLAAIVDSADDAIISTAPDGTILTWNSGAERLYGYPAGEVVGRSISLTYPPEQRDQDAKRQAGVAAGERILGVETDRIHRDGRRMRVSLSLAPLNDDAGRTIAVTGIGRDIGERQRLRYALRESHEQLAAVVGGSTDAIFLLDPDHRYLLVNEAAAGYIGRPVPELLGRTIREVLPPEVAAEFEAAVDTAVGAGQPVTSVHDLNVNGVRTIWQASLGPYRNEKNEIAGVFGIARDVTLQRSSAESLARSQALLAAAEVIANLGSFEVDLATGGVQWSDHLYRMADMEPGQQLDYEGFLGIVHPDDRPRVRATIKDAIGRRADHTYEFRVPRKDGKERVLSCEARIVSDAEGRPVRIFGTAKDVTDTRRLEHEFRQSQKMEAVGRLAGGIAHDFNNALTAIIGYGQILADSLGGKPEAEWVAQIDGAARHAAGLTRQLLAFSRRQVLKPEVLDVPALVEELAPMMGLLIGENVELVTTIEPETGHVRADPGQLQQVLLNLAMNARDAMPDGGRLTICVGNFSLDALPAAVLQLPPGSYVSLTVEDNGQGMDEATKARIFEPFFTTKEVGKGTGLGLATVHGVVTQSGGHISFDSDPGQGTIFRILLPSVGSAPLPAPVETPEPVPQRLTGRVLLVEDERVVRELTRLTLEANGLSVVEAPDAERALEEIDRSPDFDLVISDVVMPGSGGGALAEELRARGHDVPIIFVSGYPRDAAVVRGVSESEYPYLAKPFRPSQLIALVHKTLQGRPDAGPRDAPPKRTRARSRRARARAPVAR
jgi:two-component system cell cycle sensor histidine kinase/response regulator CckA